MTISIHALLAESDTKRLCNTLKHLHFYPRSPCGERQAIYPNSTPPKEYFYPRSPCGERLVNGGVPLSCFGNFYPRSPCGERLDRWLAGLKGTLFLSTLSLRRATLALSALGGTTIPISIHALLAESDVFSFCFSVFDFLFLSTLSLRRATPVRDVIQWEGIFLSTLSLRRATLKSPIKAHRQKHFYPRSPCGERLQLFQS